MWIWYLYWHIFLFFSRKYRIFCNRYCRFESARMSRRDWPNLLYFQVSHIRYSWVAFEGARIINCLLKAANIHMSGLQKLIIVLQSVKRSLNWRSKYFTKETLQWPSLNLGSTNASTKKLMKQIFYGRFPRT